MGSLEARILLRRDQTGDGLEQRGLPRAVGADHRNDLPGRHFQVDAEQRRKSP
jgi:hypothetical protein